MKAKKKNTELKIKSTKVSVDPPKGYHWMEDKGRYYLMKGDYAPHDMAVKRAEFKLATH